MRTQRIALLLERAKDYRQREPCGPWTRERYLRRAKEMEQEAAILLADGLRKMAARKRHKAPSKQLDYARRYDLKKGRATGIGRGRTLDENGNVIPNLEKYRRRVRAEKDKNSDSECKKT